ncbi:hypothetical protein BP6252_12623 [Coleophoma cylindrospora]|uniref:Uncharacterized protein n=1 Tax=Coleophoma cylindrospora TaxID=1849047 RepID=A0A3D8QCF5_9HELO|nr:hypothetical protein BP6252_12623 [Coleophoma cylindrospora]
MRTSTKHPLKKAPSWIVLWKWEVAAIVSSAALLAAIVAVLVTYNGKEIFTWHGITLNAIISILSTASKASLLFTIGDSMGQWRLILFVRQSRPLKDLARVYDASRGPWVAPSCSPFSVSLRARTLVSMVESHEISDWAYGSAESSRYHQVFIT